MPPTTEQNGRALMEPIFEQYADVYDILYQDKDYAGECDFIESLIGRYACPVRRILDVAAGTGGHALLLAKRGYDVTAYDYSQRMASIAREKAQRMDLSIPIEGGVSMADLPPSECPHDAVIALFASVDYLAEEGQIEAFLDGARTQLDLGGLLIFDFWNGIACLADLHSSRRKEARLGSTEVVRISETALDAMRNKVDVLFRCSVLCDGNPVRDFSELHRLRYYFPSEMVSLVKAHGYDVLGLVPFGDHTRDAVPSDWNLTVIAKKAVRA